MFRKGYHPLVFKNATLYTLPKLGKRHRELPRSYCFIVLLSSLRKALEKIVARRLRQMALKYFIVSSLYYGAIIGQSVVDITTILIYNVNKVFNKKYILTTLAINMKGTFKKMIKKQFIQRLYKQMSHYL